MSSVINKPYTDNAFVYASLVIIAVVDSLYAHYRKIGREIDREIDREIER